MSVQHDLSGQQVKQYLLKHKIGDGYFGQVYYAEHVKSGDPVAIKLLFASVAAENISELLVEAKLSLFQHPHIVRIKDFGIHNGHAYFVMNYVPHGTLKQLHPNGTVLPWETVASYAQQIAEALQYIHNKDIVHRDVKPDNLLVGEDGSLQLSDFGIAVTSYTVDMQRQQPKGTPYYTAPEQITGHARRASDQYSLGAIMYEWLSGAPLFEGTANQVVLKHLNVPPAPLRSKNSTISPEVEALILKMLQKNPAERFKDMEAFLAELARIKKATDLHDIVIFTQHTAAVQSLSWSPDGKFIASAGHDKTVHVWEATTGQVSSVYREHTNEIWSVMWSPNGTYIASAGADKLLKVWDVSSNRTIATHAEHQKTMRAVSWSPDSTAIASAGDDTIVHIWDFLKARFQAPYSQHNERVLCLAWSPNNKYIASGGNDCTIRVWDALTSAYCTLFRGHTDKITSIAWSPDSTHIASASDDGTIQVWQATTGQPTALYNDHSQTVAAVAWSPDGQYIVSGSWDKTVRIWDRRQNICIHVYKGHTAWINAVAWSPAGQYIASASWDNTVHVFSFEENVITLSNATTLPNL